MRPLISRAFVVIVSGDFNSNLEGRLHSMNTRTAVIFFVLLLAPSAHAGDDKPSKVPLERGVIYSWSEGGSPGIKIEALVMMLGKNGARTIIARRTDGKDLDDRGTFVMNPKVLAKSRSLRTAFKTNAYEELSDETAFWLSKETWSALKKGKTAPLAIEGCPSKEVGKATPSTIRIGTSGPIAVIEATTDDGRKLVVLDDPKNPLVVRLDGDKKLELTGSSSVELPQ